MKKLNRIIIVLLFIFIFNVNSDTNKKLNCDSLEENYYPGIPQPHCYLLKEKTEFKKIGFDGIVITVLPSPGFWSGFFAAFQGVVLYVNNDNKENITNDAVIVYYRISSNPLCEKDKPVLSKKIFKPGNKLNVIAEITPNNDYIGIKAAIIK